MRKARVLFHQQSLANAVQSSIYIHWPYCAKRCTYCNFNKYVPKGSIDQERWKAGLQREVRTLRNLSGTTKVVSVFYGGGTPSMMKPKSIEVCNKKNM